LASAEATAESVPYRPSDEDWQLDLGTLLIVLSVMLAVMLEIIDTSIVNVALPSMMGSLGATLDEIDWVITGYIVSNVIIIPMTGWLAARFGRKRYFVTSILIFTAASLLCGTSTSATELVLWRIVQGMGGGALVATSQAVLVETFPPSKQGVGQAIFGFGAMIGPSLGPTLGGWITDNYSWHWIFFINVPLGLGAAMLCATYLEEPAYLANRRPSRIDWPGITFLVVGVGCLQTLLERGHKDDWFQSPFIMALAVAAGVSIVALVIRELTTEHPIVDLRVLRRRPLAVGCCLAVLMGVGLYGTVFLFPVFTQSLLDWNAWNSGLAILPSTAATAVVMLYAGRLVWRIGPRPLLWTGMVLMIFALSLMSRWNLQTGWDQILIPQILRGTATGMMFVPLATATLRALPTEEVPAGAGLYNLCRQLGGSFGIAALTTVLDQRGEIHRTNIAGYVGPLTQTVAHQLDALTGGFVQRGFDVGTARNLAAASIDQMVSAHASMMAFQDAYVVIASLFAIAIPVVFLVARHAPGKVAPIR
jgi:DHA2 family multidrug resistance protein